ncbi:hypothetical protein TNCV_3888421 [Trichonephila clavipes]|nr:hypothetical protein TNCV_3888421 [Trichonephila clavipes]
MWRFVRNGRYPENEPSFLSSLMKERRFVLGTFDSERMRVRNRSRRNDRLRMMLVRVHIDITPPQHHGNLPTWAGVELVTLGTEGQRQTNYATLPASFVIMYTCCESIFNLCYLVTYVFCDFAFGLCAVHVCRILQRVCGWCHTQAGFGPPRILAPSMRGCTLRHCVSIKGCKLRFSPHPLAMVQITLHIGSGY